MRSNPFPAGVLPVKRKTQRGPLPDVVPMRRCRVITGWLACQCPETWPVNGVSEPKDACYAFTHATIVKDAQTTLQ